MNSKERKNEGKTRQKEDLSLCPETSTKNAVKDEEFHLSKYGDASSRHPFITEQNIYIYLLCTKNLSNMYIYRPEVT